MMIKPKPKPRTLKPGWTIEYLPDIISPGAAEILGIGINKMRSGNLPPVRLTYVLKKNIATGKEYPQSNYAGIYYNIQKFTAIFSKGVNRESVLNLPTEAFSKLYTEINSFGGAFVGFIFEENDVGVKATVKKSIKLMHPRSFQPILRCWCEDSSGNEFVYDHLAENEQDMKYENLWPSSLDAFVGIIALKNSSSLSRHAWPGVINPNLNVHIESTSTMADNSTKLEDAAMVVCKYGKDSKMSSKDAAEKIIKNLQVWVAPAESEQTKKDRTEKVQEEIKKYRNGLGLEDTTNEILKIINPQVELQSTGLFDEGFYKRFSFPNLLVPLPVNRGVCANLIGDMVENKSSVLPDKTWLWCIGTYILYEDYNDLYKIMSAYILPGGVYPTVDPGVTVNYQFDERRDAVTSKLRFLLPYLTGHMIKAL